MWQALSTALVKLNLYRTLAKFLGGLLGIWLFLVALDLMGSSLKISGESFAFELISIGSSPFISLFIGLLSTAIVQSSSFTTSMIVALVASNSLPLTGAVYMVMGANIGTTVTSTVVSLGFITKKKEFRKAISAGVMHDFFNLFTAAVLFPLEYFSGFLSSSAQYVTSFVTGKGTSFMNLLTPLYYLVKPVSNWLIGTWSTYPFVLLFVSVVFLFAAIRGFSYLIQTELMGDNQRKMEQYFFGSDWKSLLSGMLLTGAIQSSSVTTSLIVPLVATNKIHIRKAFSFVIGANIGTTVTAFIAAFAINPTAVSLAMAHLLFNVFGFLIFFPIPFMRNIPLALARKLGELTVNNRLIGLAYLVIIFFLVPFVMIYLSKN